MSSKQEFVTLARQEGTNMQQLCARFGISRPTGYKWLGRFATDGLAGLIEQSRRPHTTPTRTAAALEARVLALRDAHPTWGGRKLRARLLAAGQPTVPSASTITAILGRHGRLDPTAAARHTACTGSNTRNRMPCGSSTSRGMSPWDRGAATR